MLLLLSFIAFVIFALPGNLVDWQIRLCLALGLLKIDNYRDAAIQPNSLDVHLGKQFARQKADGNFDSFEANFIVLEPGDFVLATTEEYFYFPSNLHGVLQGKSSWARLGLYVESAGLFDSGFEGEAVVELTNQGKSALVLESGRAIAQMVFARNLAVANPYGKKKFGSSNYQGQKGAQESCLAGVIDSAHNKLNSSKLVHNFEQNN